MYKKTDVPVNSQSETLASRLRMVREGKNFSRRAASEETGIPQNSIEKFENGSQEPTVSRLQSLAELYEVTVDWLLNGEENEEAKSLKGNSPTSPENEARSEAEEEVAQDVTETPSDNVRVMLSELDELREGDFKNGQRYALALAKDAVHMIGYLEVDELEKLAHERELHQEDEEQGFKFSELFQDNPHEADEQFVGIVAERIADTALLGVDLYQIEADVLSGVADRLHSEKSLFPEGYNKMPFSSWGEHDEVVPLIRKALRAKFVSSKEIDFSNLEEFINQ